MSINIDSVYNKLVNDIRANPRLEYNLVRNVQKLVHSVQMLFIQKSEEGYCSKFTIPDRDITSIFIEFPSLIDTEIQTAFAVDWGVPKNAHMHNNIYYHKLLLLTYYAAKTNNDDLGHNALSLILFRIWNGRMCKLIKWCNPETMKAAVAKTSSKLIKQYSTPLDLIEQYFAKTIFAKYKPYMLKDSIETKRTFEQCHNRLKQVFGSNNQTDLETGQIKYQTGLQPDYYKAHESKHKISTVGINTDSEDKFSSSELENIIEHVSRFISTYRQVSYDSNFVQMVTANVKGYSTKSVSELLEKIHKLKYHDIIREIVEIIYRRFRGITQQEICSPKIYDYLRTRIISSKNTKDVTFLKEITDKLLDNIFRDDFSDKTYGTTYLQKSDNHKSQIRSVLFYGILYNMQKATCEYK